MGMTDKWSPTSGHCVRWLDPMAPCDSGEGVRLYRGLWLCTSCAVDLGEIIAPRPRPEPADPEQAAWRRHDAEFLRVRYWGPRAGEDSSEDSAYDAAEDLMQREAAAGDPGAAAVLAEITSHR